MKSMLSQLFKLVFLKNIPNSIDYYSDLGILSNYQDKKSMSLTNEEKNILNFVKNFDSVLIIGGGTGREAFNLINHFDRIINQEPVLSMWPKNTPGKLEWIQDISNIQSSSISNIWVSTNVISFMNSNERKKLIEKCCEILTRDGIIFVCPDIMPLTLRSSFKYLVFSYILKYWVKMPFFIEGDSLRPSLESKSTHNSTVKIGLVYYHYFPSENHFTSEWKQLNFKVEKINSEFYMIKK